MNHLTEFQQRAAAQGVMKLLNGDTFYISDLRKLAELLARPVGGADWLAMEPLHCVKWGDMDPTLRQMLREKVLEVLGLPPETLVAAPQHRGSAEQQQKPPEKRPRLAFWRSA